MGSVLATTLGVLTAFIGITATPEQRIQLATAAVLPGWGACLFAPGSKWTAKAVKVGTCFVAFMYLVGLVRGGSVDGADFTSLSGVRSIFRGGDDDVVTSCWLHYLVFDLLVGWYVKPLMYAGTAVDFAPRDPTTESHLACAFTKVHLKRHRADPVLALHCQGSPANNAHVWAGRVSHVHGPQSRGDLSWRLSSSEFSQKIRSKTALFWSVPPTGMLRSMQHIDLALI